jgi:hypothetical protein
VSNTTNQAYVSAFFGIHGDFLKDRYRNILMLFLFQEEGGRGGQRVEEGEEKKK